MKDATWLLVTCSWRRRAPRLHCNCEHEPLGKDADDSKMGVLEALLEQGR